MKRTIKIPFEVYAIKCVNCGVSYSVIGHGTDETYWPQQKTEFCPYCGKLAPNKALHAEQAISPQMTCTLCGKPGSFVCKECANKSPVR